jgi:uncharacterized protein (TIGR03083 family)
MDIQAIDPIERHEMVGLATTEYERLLALLRDLTEADWDRPTACVGWSVRDMVAHLLGTAEGNASQLENTRQLVRGGWWARAHARPLVDGINAVQIADRRHLTPQDLLVRLEAAAPRAVRGRLRMPAPLRGIPVPAPTGRVTMGHLVDVVYTRDEWMHRVDLADATGRALILTPEHDGRIVADVVREWAHAHGQPVRLHLTGPAGGRYTRGEEAPTLESDAVAFCLAVSGRAPAEGLLSVPVLF